MTGWLVRASLPAPAGTAPWASNFRVALSDPAAAVAAVQAHVGPSRNLTIIAVSQLSEDMLRALEIGAGEIRSTR